MNVPLTVVTLAGSAALLLWGVRMVQTGVQRACGAKPPQHSEPGPREPVQGVPCRRGRNRHPAEQNGHRPHDHRICCRRICRPRPGTCRHAGCQFQHDADRAGTLFARERSRGRNVGQSVAPGNECYGAGKWRLRPHMTEGRSPSNRAQAALQESTVEASNSGSRIGWG